ncbi:MAG: DNRLRE domain-containing protein [Limisphaerales bacterium]
MRFALVLFLATSLTATAGTLDQPMVPVSDTCLIEIAPDNNMGGQTYFNAGSNMQGTRNRGLLRFDLSQIPPGSLITSATLTLWVVGVPTDGPAGSIFDLHRMLKPWGEGSELAIVGAGRGSPATTNEATWNDRFAYANAPWTAPGGKPDADYLSGSTAEKFISDTTSYDFRFGTLAQDVQFWLDNPQSNFGWMLMARDETQISTARRFGSREDPDNTPTLDITFIPATHIDAPTISSNQITFNFVAFAQQNYAVEYCDALATNWTVLTNIPAQLAQTNIIVSDSLTATQRFYRINAQ